MHYKIVLSPEAVRDRCQLQAYDRAIVDDAIERHLRYEPTKVSRSRTKRLRGLARPQYRLRVEDFRVFYDVSGNEVQILAIVAKTDVDRWLEEVGELE